MSMTHVHTDLGMAPAATANVTPVTLERPCICLAAGFRSLEIRLESGQPEHGMRTDAIQNRTTILFSAQPSN